MLRYLPHRRLVEPRCRRTHEAAVAPSLGEGKQRCEEIVGALPGKARKGGAAAAVTAVAARAARRGRRRLPPHSRAPLLLSRRRPRPRCAGAAVDGPRGGGAGRDRGWQEREMSTG